jgi:hypothetical protein
VGQPLPILIVFFQMFEPLLDLVLDEGLELLLVVVVDLVFGSGSVAEEGREVLYQDSIALFVEEREGDVGISLVVEQLAEEHEEEDGEQDEGEAEDV